jgi:hypothetical protein
MEIDKAKAVILYVKNTLVQSVYNTRCQASASVDAVFILLGCCMV